MPQTNQELKEISGLVASIGGAANELVRAKWSRYAIRSIDALLRGGISELLVHLGTKAAEQIAEYRLAPAMIERLRENLSDKRHVKVKDGVVLQVFNPKVAGTVSDLRKGLARVYGLGTSSAPAVWKYGIYLPYAEGRPVPKGLKNWFEKKGIDNNYRSVIDRRLAAWGRKAPFWYFVEFGNQGSGRAYPSFPGTHFIAQTKSIANQLASDTRNLYLKYIFDNLTEQVDFIADGSIAVRTGGSRQVASSIVRGKVGVREFITAEGESFFSINQRSVTYDQFLGQLLRRLRGR